MKAKRLLIVMYLFCVGLLSAQNSPFIQKWEQQARSRGAAWNSYTRVATAANRPTYTSLFVNGTFIASFQDYGSCQSKVRELVKMAERMQGQSSSSKTSSGNTKRSQAIDDLGRRSGVDVNALRNQLTQKFEAANTQSKQEALSKVEGLCKCRTENNPNYDPNAKPYDFDAIDLFSTATDDDADDAPYNPLLDGVQTQFDNPFDAPSARTPLAIQQGDLPNVSLNFDDAGRYIGGIRVGDNYKGIIPQQPIYLGDINDYHYLNWPAKQNPNGMYPVLPGDKERGIQLAKDLLPLAEKRLANFDKTMAEIESTENKIISEYDDLIFQTEKRSAIAEYQKSIAYYGDDESKHTVGKYDLKNKFGLTEEEIVAIRRTVANEVKEADWRKTFKSDDEVFNGETLEGAIARDVIVPASRSLDLLNGSEVRAADVRSEMRLLDVQDKYEKAFENSQGDIPALRTEKANQLDKISDLKKRYTAEKDDILKAKSYYSNVIQDGKIVVTSENGIDAMNCGTILNSIIIRR